MGFFMDARRVEDVGRMFTRLSSPGTPSYLRSLARIWGCPRVSQLRCRLNPRLTTSLARLRSYDGLIEFNLTVAGLDGRDQQEVICHEAAHFVGWQRYGRTVRPHGPEWATLVQRAGFEPKTSRVRCGQREPS